MPSSPRVFQQVLAIEKDHDSLGGYGIPVLNGGDS